MAMTRSFVLLLMLVLTAGACGEGASVGAGGVPSRCTGDADTVQYDTGVGDPTAEEAVARAQRERGLGHLTFVREATSNVWVAAGSADPEAVIEVSRQDADGWFVSSVTTCEDAVPVDRSGAASGLPHRVLVEGPSVGDVYVTDLAASGEDFNALWSRLGLAGPVPEVDFASSVVLYFGAVESGSCPLGKVEALMLDEGKRRVYPAIPMAGGDSAVDVCTDDAGLHAVLIEVDRTDLPDGEFSIWIDESDPPACCTEGVTVVTGDELAGDG